MNTALIHQNQNTFFQDTSQILIIEDDISYEPFWIGIIRTLAPYAYIQWVNTEEAAERCIKALALSGKKYDLIIADIFLSGKKTGLDFWAKYGTNMQNFVIVSGLPREDFNSLISSKNSNYPAFLEKPLHASQCLELLRHLIEPKE